VQTVTRDGSSLLWSLSTLLKNKDRYNRLEQQSQLNKFMLYLMARSFNQQLQLLDKLRVKEVHSYLFYTIFLTTTVTHKSISVGLF
jgi:hypothetical protein